MSLKETEPFLATLKLTTSEEVLAEVMATEENGEDFFVLGNPIIISENTQIDTERGIVVSGLTPKKWMLYSNEELTIVYKQHVVSISELDKFGIDFYKKALMAAKVSSPIKRKVESEKHTGYVGKIESWRKGLEKLWDNSPPHEHLTEED